MQCSWQKKAAEDATWDSFAAYNAISLMANIPTYADSLERDAYSNIEAEDLDYCKGLISENSGGTSGGRSLGGVMNGNYAAYYNIDFGDTGASKLTFRYSRKTETEGANGTIEFRLGSTTGPLIAKASIENTGTWQNWKEVTIDTARITGVQNVYVVFKTNTIHVCNFDYFKFTKATNDDQGYFFLKSDSSNQYAKCKNGSSDTTIVASSDKRDEWEQFKIIKNSDGTFSFKSLISGKYICMVSEGSYLTASTSAIYNGEKFVIERFASDTSKSKQFAIKSIANGKYLAVDPSGDKAILSTSNSIGGSWETFHMETVNGEWIVPDGTTLVDSAYKDAFSKIEAEKTDDFNGTINYDTYLGNTNDGEWARYDSVRFTKTAKSIIMRYSVRGKIATGKVSLYLDSLDGTPVGEFYLTETAEDSWDAYVEKQFALKTEISAGVHNVYLKFTPDSGKTYVGNIDYFLFSDEAYVEPTMESGSIKIEGYQISATRKGSRVVGSVEPTIDGKNVVGWGLIYGVNKAGGNTFNISDNDMRVNSDSKYVAALDSTSQGTTDTVFGSSDTATYFVRTTLFGSFTSVEYSAEYKIRAYAKLSDGTYRYSTVKSYSVYDIADVLYKNVKMNTITAHEYLYNSILKVVNPNYAEVDYSWGNDLVGTN